eukprot:12497846-Alexandrium_andersonii.AAC.1
MADKAYRQLALTCHPRDALADDRARRALMWLPLQARVQSRTPEGPPPDSDASDSDDGSGDGPQQQPSWVREGAGGPWPD